MEETLRLLGTEIIQPLIKLIFALAVVYFLWGVFVFVKNADDIEERKKGASHMLWGVVGIFIMVSVYGIMLVIIKTLDIPAKEQPRTIDKRFIK